MKFLLFILLLSLNIYAQINYFYTGKDYGSEALYNPVNLILNGSYDIIQLQHHDRNILNVPYSIAAKNVFSNLASPVSRINEVGWKTFLSREVFPLEFTKKGAQWWPNYQLHLIGGGMTYTSMKEWYRYNNLPNPELMSLLTVAGYHIMNEIVENGAYRVPILIRLLTFIFLILEV